MALKEFTDISYAEYREYMAIRYSHWILHQKLANLFNKCLKESKSFDSICKVKSKKGSYSLAADFYYTPAEYGRQN